MSENDRKKLSTGQSAGLKSSHQFRDELNSQVKQSGLDKHELSGKNAETVYRDRKGRKLDMLNEFMRQQAAQDGKKHKLEQAQYSWGMGSKQKEELNEKVKELEEIAYEPFARTSNDAKLEAVRKSEIRDGDPMAAYFATKKLKEEPKQSSSPILDSTATTTTITTTHGIAQKKAIKPKYKGPLPPPNRFKILPGYRWDAIDRSNHFEHKILVKLSDKKSLKEDEYKYLASDL